MSNRIANLQNMKISSKTLGAFSSFLGLLPIIAFFILRILLKQVVSLKFSIIIYVGNFVLGEYLFWSIWTKEISEHLRTKQWSTKINPSHYVDVGMALFFIFEEAIFDIFLINTGLNLGTDLRWIFLVLASFKAIGVFIQRITCALLDRKKTMMISHVVLLVIVFVLMLSGNSVKLFFSLLIIKGLLGNLASFSKIMIADRQEIVY